jgi:hydroxypyruvate reductase
VITRATCEGVFLDAVRACDPAMRVRLALQRAPLAAPIVGLAVGKAALAMARGVGPVGRGLVITNALDGRGVPTGWTTRLASHPVPDASSVEAGLAALALVESAGEDDTVLALVSGGASSLLEVPANGVTLDELVRRTTELARRGAPIHELNALRTELSAVKGGKLADRALGSVVTLVVSDVIGDDPHVVGSGPTVSALRPGARVEVVAPMALFGEEVVRALGGRGIEARRGAAPIAGDVAAVADAIVSERGPFVAWGEPTVKLPAVPGTGGRAQQLALELARRLRGTERSALVAGSDGIDGNSRAAGAYVDGTTWEALVAAGISPDDALARCDAGTALEAVGALLVTGPTGVNHADVVLLD